MNFQEIILKLEKYWSEQGCCIGNPYDIEKGAGTMNPLTFFKTLGEEPWKVCYVEPSRRPKDGRYGENPNRLYQHHQFQVVLKPSPENIVDLYLDSLVKLGIVKTEHDIRLVEDNWESPTLGAFGMGWEIWLDGMEITQFTYFQQMAGIECKPVSVEITYGLERLAMYLQNKDSIFDIEWNDSTKYRDIFLKPEYEHSKYSFEVADQDLLFKLFDMYEAEAHRVLKAGLIYPAYDWFLKMSHTFNILDAKGAISVTERARYVGKLRNLTKSIAQSYTSNLQKKKED